MTITETAPPAPDLSQIKQRQQTTWASGDFPAVAARILFVAEHLVEAADLQAGWRVLDVATGSGNAAIAAARLGCDAVGIDYVPALLDARPPPRRGRRPQRRPHRGRRRGLPFPDAAFDAVLSVFGSMFAPDHEQAAAELARVCRPGGRIGLATWTPDGFIGEMLKVVAGHVPPPAGVASPLLWGSKALRERPARRAHQRARLHGADLHVPLPLRRGVRRLLPHFYGPTLKAFEAVGDAGGDALFADLVYLVRRHAGTGSGPVAIPATWLETVAIRSAYTD